MYIVEPRNHEMQHFVKKKKKSFCDPEQPFCEQITYLIQRFLGIL